MGTPMQDKASAGMTTQPIIVPEFIGEDLNYQFNDDLRAERCKGENLGIGGGRMPPSRPRAAARSCTLTPSRLRSNP
jgi:hypothetical protein